jgi:hypothetical protein
MTAIARFITENPTPSFGYKQSWLTGLGAFVLIPTQQAIGLYDAPDAKDGCCSKLAYKVLSVFLNFLLLPITLLGMLIKGVGEILPKHQYRPDQLIDTALNVWRMPLEESNIIYEQLRRFSEFCKTYQIPICIESGTQLGALRHGGLIPWDNDADFSIAAKDLSKLTEKQKELEQAGLTLEWCPEGLYKVGIKGQKPYLDLFPYDWFTMPDGEKRWTYQGASIRISCPTCYFLEDDFVDPKNPLATLDYPFGPNIPGSGSTMLLPQPMLKDAEGVMKRWYGNDCMHQGILSHTHPCLTRIFCIAFNLPNFTKCRFEITKFEPAPWTEITSA